MDDDVLTKFSTNHTCCTIHTRAFLYRKEEEELPHTIKEKIGTPPPLFYIFYRYFLFFRVRTPLFSNVCVFQFILNCICAFFHDNSLFIICLRVFLSSPVGNTSVSFFNGIDGQCDCEGGIGENK